MNTRQLTYLLTIAECESLSAAAAQLPVSQPALSKYLAELEEELGTELFIRHNKHLHPTNAGKIYLEAARRIITVKEQTYHTIAALSGHYQKTLIFGGTPLRGAQAIANTFSNFQKHYPDVQVVFKEHYAADLRQSIINGTLHMAVTTSVDPDLSDVQVATAHEEELILFVPSFHPMAADASRDMNHLTPVNIADFQDIPFLVGRKGSTIRTLFEERVQEAGFTPTIVYETDNNLFLRTMVENGVGACLLPRSHAIDTDQIAYFSLQPGCYSHLSIIFPKNHELSEEERFLTSLLFASEHEVAHYRFHPNPLGESIIHEFSPFAL